MLRLNVGPKLEWGPRLLTEIYLALNETGEIQYQFTGLDGGPAHPQVLYNMLTIARDSIVRAYTTGSPDGIIMENVT